MNLGIKNKTALVTASSRGLGKAIALELSEEGANVVICARNEAALLRAKKEILERKGGQVLAQTADVTDKDQVQRLVKLAADTFGTIDILVCNAGGPPSGMAEDFGLDDYREALELNLMSTVNLCSLAAAYMKKQKWGRIVNLTSVSAKQPIDNLILSNTARAGVLGFSKSLSSQLAPFGITVNSICPGYTRTERVEKLAMSYEKAGKGSVKDFYQNIEKSIPIGRFGRPGEIAAAAVFLCSEAASYITGVALQVDGGFVKAIF
jgi:3-oxoacyl-[acyl-carrier protein] reductase